MDFIEGARILRERRERKMAEHPTIKEVRLFKDGIGEFRFIGIAGNSLTIVESSEGYTDKENALGAIHGVFGDDVPIDDRTIEEPATE
jgi:uncharacterized protein YegP (UPF0339 family)